MEIHFGCSEWNGERLFLGLVRDITERRRTEEALRESEDRFRSIVEGAPDAIFIQIDRRFAYLNPAACRLFGAASADELRGAPVLDRIHPQYHQVVEERMRRLNEERRSLRERVEFGNRIEGSELVFHVRDSGAGIPEDRIKVIFERFMQADQSIVRPYEGCGPGLAIAKADVEALGGCIQVVSEEGKGSVFSFSIPFVRVR